MSRWKSNIKYGYAQPGQFINTETTKDYVGPYFILRGQYFESNPDTSTQLKYRLTLVPNGLNSSIVKTYNKITRNTYEIAIAPQTFFPVPVDSDYQNTYINRVIIQKRNEPHLIYEIDPGVESDFSNDPLYNIVHIQWQLVGTETQIKQANRLSLAAASRTMPGIENFLSDLLEFGRLQNIS
jgi:hypothetical protein